jgi:hypothetical protein
MQKTCSRLLVTLVLLSVISITAQVAHAASSLGDDGGSATVGLIHKPVVGRTSSEPDSPSKTPSVPVLSMIQTSTESPGGMAMRGFDRAWWISRIWAALYLRVIK